MCWLATAGTLGYTIIQIPGTAGFQVMWPRKATTVPGVTRRPLVGGMAKQAARCPVTIPVAAAGTAGPGRGWVTWWEPIVARPISTAVAATAARTAMAAAIISRRRRACARAPALTAPAATGSGAGAPAGRSRA